MATESPFSFLDEFFTNAARVLQPPAWVIEELQRRLVLLFNHVLMQEPEAQARLARQSGKVVQAHWGVFSMRVTPTRAGLLELAPPSEEAADLTLTLAEGSPWQLAQAAVRGDKPPVHIAGDVQFAAEINWLVEHVRWDIEEDLSRLIGDAPAHALGDAARRTVQTLREFVASSRRAPDAEPEGPARPGQA